MSRSVGLCLSATLVALSMGACAPDSEEAVGTASEALAHEGPWVIPEATLAIGDTQWVEYTGAGPWVGESGCSGSLTSGAEILREYLFDQFPQAEAIGGYSCRSIVGDSSTMSVHGTGRALDVMIPLDAGDADNDLGDPVGTFLIENAEAIGIQYVIWDLWSWMAAREVGAKDRAYTGENPHLDHLHIELSVVAAEHTSPWFEDQVAPPTIPGCDAVAADGAIIDDDSPCLRLFGPADYWRAEQGVGYDGGLHWTNSFEGDAPSNWARWTLSFAEAGRYDVEVYLDPAFAVAASVRYEVQLGAETLVLEVDQSAAEGWTLLGTFDFAAGGGQSVDVFDDRPVPVPDGQHVAVDALRLTREGQPPPDEPGDPPADPPGDPAGTGGAEPAALALSGVPNDSDGTCSLTRPPRRRAGGPWPAALLWLAAIGLARKTRAA